MAAVTSCENALLVALLMAKFHNKTTLVELLSGSIHFLGFYKKVMRNICDFFILAF